tara:strand:- start:63 stop:689 length:627 start_codon:yes stop_codon:yes gene_type:complete
MTKEQLKEKIKNLTQFPHGERKEQYQSYYIGDEYVEGARNIEYRFDKFGISSDLSGYSVLDLGCNLGGVCQLAFKRGARDIEGLDYEIDYIECARDLARFNKQPLRFLHMDLKKEGDFERFIAGFHPDGVDMLFMLAIDKHVGLDRCFQILDRLKFKSLFWEGSAAKDEKTKHVVETMTRLTARYQMNVKQLGYTDDRNKRFIWRVDL